MNIDTDVENGLPTVDLAAAVATVEAIHRLGPNTDAFAVMGELGLDPNSPTDTRDLYDRLHTCKVYGLVTFDEDEIDRECAEHVVQALRADD